MSSANSPDWQLSRLRRETVDRLRSFAAGLERGRELGVNHYYDLPENGAWTVDTLVQVLLDRAERKRHRSKAKRRPKGNEPEVYLG